MATYNVHGGHSLICRGASGLLDEVNEDRKVKNKVIELLRAEGHTVYDCTDDSGRTQGQNLSAIVRKCNAHKVDLDVSIHLNAGGGTGVEVENYNSNTAAISNRICANISSALGIRNRGTKYMTDLYVLRNTNSPAILIECCFVDNATDKAAWNVDKCAKAIVEGILNKSIGNTNSGNTNSRKGVGTVRKLTPGKAFLYCDAPIYKRDWKTVIINGHKGDEVTIMDSGTGGVKIKYNNSIGYMECKYLMPYISTGDLLEVVEDITVTIRKGTVLRAADNGYLGSRVTIHDGNVSIDDRFVQKVKNK